MIIEGARLVAEAIAAKLTIEAIVFSDNERGHTAWRALASGRPRGSLTAFAVPEREFDRLTDTVHAAGIACVVEWAARQFDSGLTEKSWRRTLVCDRVSDPGNVGTLIRTAAALGLDAVFLTPGTAELSNPKTIRAAAGAAFQIPVFEHAAPASLLDWSRRAKQTIVVADAHRGKSAPRQYSSWMLVIGGETLPLDSAWDKAETQWISLPLKRGVESLNAAVAGAIIMDRLFRATDGKP